MLNEHGIFLTTAAKKCQKNQLWLCHALTPDYSNLFLLIPDHGHKSRTTRILIPEVMMLAPVCITLTGLYADALGRGVIQYT